MIDLYKRFGNKSANTLQNSPVGQIKETFNFLKSAKNPQTLFARMAQNNPMYQSVMNYIQQNGGDAQKAFYNYASQCGASEKDINDVLGMLK